ncbi:MAG: methylenetetrahydrofolate reductase [Chloroflexota bacterium]|nr:MAG: methylenetetrahydrofolate reductase [Chloroflexota bacterium]
MVVGVEPGEVAASSAQTARPGSLRAHLVEPTTFVRIVELVTTRGPLAAANAARVVALGTDLARMGTVHALSITDNAGGHPGLAPESLGARLRAQGQEVMVHLSCKDLNRNGLESRAWALAAAGFENVLCLSGDYPGSGYRGQGAPVFDFDAIALLELLREMNRGLRTAASTLPPTSFFLGAAVSPFKRYERELMPQYFKLARKIAAGAAFAISQIGFDARKFDELRRYTTLMGLDVPLIANVCRLSVPMARYFHRGAVPGVVVTDELLALVERQAASPDKGKRFFHELAARQVAIARGLGYRGAYLGGHLKPDEVETIFAMADAFGRDDWRSFAGEIQFAQPGEFYYFAPDDATGLNSNEINRDYLADRTPEARRARRARAPLAYRLNRSVHDRVFAEGSVGFRLGRRLYERIDNAPSARRWLHVAEQAVKIPLFGCRDCGDCSLPEIAYLCPESQCPKNQRNGPCGGSHAGLCEVSDRECIWARAYERLKAYGEAETMLDRPIVVRNGGLRGTSAWANCFLGRDHQSKRENS